MDHTVWAIVNVRITLIGIIIAFVVHTQGPDQNACSKYISYFDRATLHIDWPVGISAS